MNIIENIEVAVFKISAGGMAKQEWDELKGGIRRAFKEVLKTTIDDKKRGSPKSKKEECFVFSYTDAEMDLSAVCMVNNGKAAFFFEEVAVERNIIEDGDKQVHSKRSKKGNLVAEMF